MPAGVQGEVTAQTAHAVLTQHTALSPNQIDELISNAGMVHLVLLNHLLSPDEY